MQTKINSHEIALTAACLADHFLNKIYDQSGLGYIGSLDVISQWSHEYYKAYYEKQMDWDAFVESVENIYKADCWDDFLYAWGAEKLNNFFKQS